MTALGPRADGLRLIRIVLVCVAVGLVINTTGTVYLYVSAQSRATETTDALCALRHDMQERVKGSQAFLREHPGGFAGIDADTIRANVLNQIRTIQALSGIDCNQ